MSDLRSVLDVFIVLVFIVVVVIVIVIFFLVDVVLMVAVTIGVAVGVIVIVQHLIHIEARTTVTSTLADILLRWIVDVRRGQITIFIGLTDGQRRFFLVRSQLEILLFRFRCRETFVAAVFLSSELA